MAAEPTVTCRRLAGTLGALRRAAFSSSRASGGVSARVSTPRSSATRSSVSGSGVSRNATVARAAHLGREPAGHQAEAVRQRHGQRDDPRALPADRLEVGTCVLARRFGTEGVHTGRSARGPAGAREVPRERERERRCEPPRVELAVLLAQQLAGPHALGQVGRALLGQPRREHQGHRGGVEQLRERGHQLLRVIQLSATTPPGESTCSGSATGACEMGAPLAACASTIGATSNT